VTNILFLIPARGGSKGLPGKNLAPVGGIPLVGRAARLGRAAARALGGGSRVVCSTDDAAIAAAARSWGAEVPFMRPAALASDGARSIDVVLHALTALGDQFDAVVLLQPTSPLTDVDDVLGAIRLHGNSLLPVVSVCPAEHPAEWLYTIDDGGRLSRLLPTVQPPDQRQAARVTFRANGAVYVSSTASLRREESFFGPETRAFVMPAERSIDVDTVFDLAAASAVVAHRDIQPVAIRERPVGSGLPCFVVAEAGVNHNGDLARAEALVDAAAEAGADAVKFQTFTADRLVTHDAPKAEYQVRATDAVESQFEMLKRLELDEEAHRVLINGCSERGILFLSTPFDELSCDFLDGLGLPAFKVPSGEVTNLPFIRHVARKQKPIILSTGMAALEEVADAVEAIWAEGNRSVILLHCVSNYPTAPEDANLRAIATLREAFGVPAGFSDHTMGDSVALAAVALGACVIEKHLTLDRSLPGPDHRASTEPVEFRAMIQRIRDVEASLGSGRKEPVAEEAAVAKVARKSLVAARSIPAGTILQANMIAVKRPGTGLAPGELGTLVGKTARIDIPEGTLFSHEMLV
jgi:N,N'-diacetyllegionaminate synthase